MDTDDTDTEDNVCIVNVYNLYIFPKNNTSKHSLIYRIKVTVKRSWNIKIMKDKVETMSLSKSLRDWIRWDYETAGCSRRFSVRFSCYKKEKKYFVHVSAVADRRKRWYSLHQEVQTTTFFR